MIDTSRGTAEAGLLGFVLTDALIDLLVAQQVITREQATGMLAAVHKKLDQSNLSLHKQCAQYVQTALQTANSVPR
ncbi:MAG TPA: hypothetical protein VHS58_15955 [Acetobacteraceae bacterium]|jgi:hypothetical protein|nr:hypothetical protein [Acetobacteraceae bacterium]